MLDIEILYYESLIWNSLVSNYSYKNNILTVIIYQYVFKIPTIFYAFTNSYFSFI